MSCKALKLYFMDVYLNKLNLINSDEAPPLSIIRMKRWIATQRCYAQLVTCFQFNFLYSVNSLKEVGDFREVLTLKQ